MLTPENIAAIRERAEKATAGPVAPNGDIYLSCAKCGEDMNNTGLKRPSTLIRERAEEHARKIGEETGVPVTDYQALLGCQVEAIKAYLDHLAGFPKSE